MNFFNVGLLAVAFVGFAWSQNGTMDNLAHLEAAVQQAKASYRTNASQANLTALQQAEADYQAFFQALPKPDRGPSVLAQILESEPNDTSGLADGPLAHGIDSGTGNIMPPGDRDFWEINGLSVGDVLFVVIDSGLSTTGTDTQICVFENDRTTIIECDDDSGDGLASATVSIVPTAGSAIVEINELGDNGTIEPYELFQFAAAPGTAVAEVESNDTTGTANGLTSPLISGDLGDMTDDVFSFGATAGDRIVIITNNDPDADTSVADTEITILDTDGMTVLGSEAPVFPTSQNAALGTATNTGVHFVQISDGGNGGDTDYMFAIIVGGTPVPVELQAFSVE